MTHFDITAFQPQAWTILSRSFQTDHIAGTYLFSGPDGSGRWALAISLAALLNCEQPVEQENPDNKTFITPCGECRNCRLIFNLSFEGLLYAIPLPPHKKEEETIDLTNQALDIKRHEPFAILSSTSNRLISIDVARQIKKRLAGKAPAGIRRVVIFYQMERMLTASADALLKLIEEPPPDTILILIAEKPELLLPTIQSRAQRIKVRSTPPEVVKHYLQSQYDLTDIKTTLLARIAQGIPGRAIAMATQDREEEPFQREEAFALFVSLLEDSPPQAVARLMTLIGDRNRGAAMELLRYWQIFLRDCTGIAILKSDEGIVNIDLQESLTRLAPYFASPETAISMTTHIKNTLADLRLNVHIHGALAALVLRMKSAMMYCR